ncbi:type II secretion system protein J [Acinetobacter sp. YH16032]|uniref:PulJ/GspJ family protein n=1 Tax=Acinetobacter sp. YH16032 TaxID=2601181 RepID=UPI0015D16738|nr:prepilin-type N-terminal cleavage/methylation domain-containing protein [Acinetobacter sp. YH16032]
MFKSINQQGFTLLESLVGLLIFSIIVFGSGLAISKMLNTQRNMNIDNILINELQNKLQIAEQTATTATICDADIFKTNIVINETTYFVACALFSTEIEALKGSSNSSQMSWPVIAASSESKIVAQQCAQGVLGASCYRVGR